MGRLQQVAPLVWSTSRSPYFTHWRLSRLSILPHKKTACFHSSSCLGQTPDPTTVEAIITQNQPGSSPRTEPTPPPSGAPGQETHTSRPVHVFNSEVRSLPPSTASEVATALGTQQGLFTVTPYSPGSPIFLPAGTIIFNRLVEFLRRQYVYYGFDEVITPTMYKKALWARSGHLTNYADNMFTVMSSPSNTVSSPSTGTTTTTTVAEKDQDNATLPKEPSLIRKVSIHSTANSITPITPPELSTDPRMLATSDQYALKPMNCPGHCLAYATTTRSYRELPIRFADFGSLHRDEVTGALTGLTRVRRFHQDDGHVFCMPSQVESEIISSIDFVRVAYETLGLGPYRFVLSTRPVDHYIGTAEEWAAAEEALSRALDHSVGRRVERSEETGDADSDGEGVEEGGWSLSPGEGAFYGPKIDIVLKDKSGKEHQTATIQLDFQLPKRFNLTYVAPSKWEDGTENPAAASEGARKREHHTAANPTPVLIHRAVLGSVERTFALLIEHYQGKWPFWLNPRQAIVLTVSQKPGIVDWAHEVRDTLLGLGGRRQRSSNSMDMAAGPAPLRSPLRASELSGLAVDIDISANTLSYKVARAQSQGYGVIAVVGEKDVKSRTVSVEATMVPGMRVESPAPGVKRMRNIPVSPVDLVEWMKDRVDNYL